MTIQSLLLGWLIASACGALFHLLRGDRLPRMVLYLITAWGAFFIGHFISELLDWNFMRVGTLNLFPALLATFIGLFAASILAGPEKKKKRKRQISGGV